MAGFACVSDAPDDNVTCSSQQDDACGAVLTQAASCEVPGDSAEAAKKVFGGMEARRRVLTQILEMLDQPVEAGLVNDAVREMQKDNRSVFQAESYCTYLQSVGAIKLVAQDGTPYDQVKVEPVVEVVDGEEYMRPGEKPPACWQVTPLGKQVLVAQEPAPRIAALLDNEPQYLHVYRTILELCAQEGGCQVAALGDAVDDDPAVQNPRRLATHFTDKLEQVDAIEYTDAWHCTDAGLEALAAL